MTALFETVLDLSLTGSWVIAGIILLRLLLRKAPKRYSYLLWSAAGFRLCCPVSFESMFSFFNLIPTAPAPTVQDAPTVAPQVVTAPAQTLSAPVTYAPAPAAAPAIDPMAIFSLIWAAGMAVMAVCAIVSCVRLKGSLDTAVREEGNIWLSDAVRSPFILGYVNPRIYLPFSLRGDELKYVLAHERHHLRRGDHFVKLFAFCLLTLHWFNPLVWLAFSLMNRDMEMSCDEYVLGRHENIASRYSMTLLSFASNCRFPAPSPLAFGESDVKPRIRNALSWKRPRAWLCILLALVCAGLIVGCVSDPVTETEPEDSVLYFRGGSIVAQDIGLSYLPTAAEDFPYVILNGDELSVFDQAVTLEDGVYTPVDPDTDPQLIYRGDQYSTETLTRDQLAQRLVSDSTRILFFKNGQPAPYSPILPDGDEFQLRRYFDDPVGKGEVFLTLYISDGVPVWLEGGTAVRIMELIPTGGTGTLAQTQQTTLEGTLYYRCGQAEGTEAWRFLTLEGDELSLFSQDLFVVNGVLLSDEDSDGSAIVYRGSNYTTEFLNRQQLAQRLADTRIDLPQTDGDFEIRRYCQDGDPDRVFAIVYLLEGQPLWLGTPDGSRLLELTVPQSSGISEYHADGDELVLQAQTDTGTRSFRLLVMELTEEAVYIPADQTGQILCGVPFTVADGTVNVTSSAAGDVLVTICLDPNGTQVVAELPLSPGQGSAILDMDPEQLYFLRCAADGNVSGGIYATGSGTAAETAYDLTVLEGLDMEAPQYTDGTLTPVTTGSAMITIRNLGSESIRACVWWDSQKVGLAAEPVTIAPGETGRLAGLIPDMLCYLELTCPTNGQLKAVIDDGLDQEGYTAPMEGLRERMDLLERVLKSERQELEAYIAGTAASTTVEFYSQTQWGDGVRFLSRVTHGIGDTHPPLAGLYYSPNDTPLAMTGSTSLKLTEAGSGWTWEARDGSTGYIERLAENWFYFEGK